MKKRNTILTLSALCFLTLGLAVGCGPKKDSGTDDPAIDEKTAVLAKNFDFSFVGKFGVRTRTLTTRHETLLESGTTGIKLETYNVPAGFDVTFKFVNAADGSDASSLVSVDENGNVTLGTVDKLTTIIVSCEASNDTNKNVVTGELHLAPANSFARGNVELVSLSGEEQEQLLGLVEEYLYENGMAGLSFYKGSGYTKISSRVKTNRNSTGKFNSEDYLVGYGFLHDQYSYLETANPKETNSARGKYWHDISANLPDLNYYLASGSSTTDEWAKFTATYFDTALDAENNVVSIPALSTVADPIPLDSEGKEVKDYNEGDLFADWKIPMRTDVKYKNNGTKNGSEWNNKVANIEDFLVPFYIQYNQFMGAQNVAQLMSGASALKGSADYYASTAEKPTSELTIEQFDEAFEGIDIDYEDNALVFHFNLPTNSNFSGYYLNNYGPMPFDFLKKLGDGDVAKGLQYLGRVKESDGSKIVDNVLSTGAYYVEAYDQDRAAVYKKNTDYSVKKDPANRDLYKLEGRITNVDTRLKDDPTGDLIYQQYTEGFIESSSIPSSKLNDEKSKPDTIHIKNTGDSYGIGIKGLSWVDYQYLFGENGVALGSPLSGNYGVGAGAHAKKDQAEIKDILSNKNFLLGLQSSFNRTSYATEYGYTPTADTFLDIYKLNPKAENAYNETQAHLDAVENVFGKGGISLASNSKGVEYFVKAIAEELKAGHLTLGTGQNPTKINFDVFWQSTNWIQRLGTPIFTMIQETFATAVKTNTAWVDGGKPRIVLEFTQTACGNGPNDYYNVYIDNQFGKHDFCQVSISGGAYNVLDQLGNWNSYNANSGLTVKYGQITDLPNDKLFFKGKFWSLDGIWGATQHSEGFALRDDGSFDNSFYGLVGETDFLDPSLYEK